MSYRKKQESTKPQEEKGVKEQISNLPQTSQGKTYTTGQTAQKSEVTQVPTKGVDLKSTNPPLLSRAPKDDIPLSTDPRLKLDEFSRSKSDQSSKLQTQSNVAENKEEPKKSWESWETKEPSVPLYSQMAQTKTEPEPSKTSQAEKKEWTDKKEENVRESTAQTQGTSFAPPQTTQEAESASNTFSKAPIDEQMIKDYITSALAYLKEAEEKMLEKFAEAREKLNEMHAGEKLHHAVDVTKEKISNVVGATVEDVGSARLGIIHTYEKVKDVVVNIAEKVSETAKSSYDTMKVKLGDLGHKTVEEYDVAKEKVSDISHKAKEMFESTKNKVESISEGVVEKTKEFLMSANDDLQEATERVRLGIEEERQAELNLAREKNEERESREAQKELEKLLNEEDERTRIRLLEQEAPQSLPK